jgi:hypothetical protein
MLRDTHADDFEHPADRKGKGKKKKRMQSLKTTYMSLDHALRGYPSSYVVPEQLSLLPLARGMI